MPPPRRHFPLLASSARPPARVLPILLAAALVLAAAAPARAQAPDPSLDGLAGLERARALAGLTLRDRDQDATAALGWGREALEILGRVPDARIRADVLAEMAWARMVLGDYAEAVRLGESARREAVAAEYPQGEARALNSLGVIARRRGDAATALVRFNETLALRRAARDSAGIAMALNNLGFLYSTDLGDFDRSLEHHMEAMRIREGLDRPTDLALSLNNIGVLYQGMGDLDRAQEYLERALELRRRHDIPLRVAGTLSNLGEVMLARGDADGALGHFRTAMGIRADAGEPTSIASSHLHIGQALIQLERHREAEASLERSLALAEALGETRSLARIHQAMGDLASRSGRHDRAEEHLLHALELADGMGARHLVAEMYGMLADVREAAGDADGALRAHRLFKAAGDQVLDEDRARRFASLEARYQAERREREIEALRHDRTVRDLELARQRLLRDLLALLAGGLVVVGVLLQRRRAAVAREVNRRLEVAARTDPLTGLDNRRAFVERAEEERARMQRSGRPASVILGDVDHFKAFNDRHGHAVGDRVLRHVARLLAEAVREQDTVARWGGEEFVFLLPETSAEGAAVVAEKLRTTVSGAPVRTGDDAVASLTMTFGVAAARHDTTVDAWILAADDALYGGKAAGRDRVEVSRRTMRPHRNGVLLVAALLAGASPAAAQEAPRTHAPDSVSQADYARAESFLAASAGPRVTGTVEGVTWLPDGRFWYRTTDEDGPRVHLVDPRTRERRPLLDPARLARALSEAADTVYEPGDLPYRSFRLSEDLSVVELGVGDAWYACDTGSYRCSRGQPAPPAPGADEVVSPDGRKGAFIREHDLWVRDLATGRETRLTTDGVEDFGYATDNAGWTRRDRPVLRWSPDSRRIATFQHDARGVGEMYLVSTEVGHPELQAWRYPLPEDTVIFRIHRVVVDLEAPGGPEVVRLRLAPDPHRSTVCDHVSCGGTFADVEWSPDGGRLAFVSSSRDHKSAVLRVADATTGEVRDVLEETVETFFESGYDGPNWRFLPGSNEVIWFSQRDDWGHLYLHDLRTGALKRQVTSGDWNVLEVLRVDPESRTVWLAGSGREPGDPYFRYLYSVPLDGGEPRLLTPDSANHELSLSPSGAFVVDTWSTPTTPPVSVVRDARGEQVMELERADISRLVASGWRAPEPFVVKARDGVTDLHGLLFRPTGFDPARAYPIVNYIYPGPQSGSVGSRSFSAARRDLQALAELGFVVVALDAMGTPMRSKSFHEAYYGNMGDNGLPDQIAGMRQLAERHPWIDLERAGIFGHSGGGYASADAILRYPDFFHVAVSQAGNHDNRIYEDDWGEKWQGLLERHPDGSTNYDNQANQLLARNLRGKLLLAHGTLDDNVPPNNTLVLVDSLIAANKDFDLILFPNRRHGFGNEPYMMRRRWDYFVEHLLGARPPRGYEIGAGRPVS